jgi:hypothetical protein
VVTADAGVGILASSELGVPLSMGLSVRPWRRRMCVDGVLGRVFGVDFAARHQSNKPYLQVIRRPSPGVPSLP